MATATLEKELETYRRELSKLLPDEGKYVLIQDAKVEGVWADYETALKEGYERFGLKPFLVKRIEWAETVLNFTRDVSVCPQSMSPSHPPAH